MWEWSKCGLCFRGRDIVSEFSARQSSLNSLAYRTKGLWLLEKKKKKTKRKNKIKKKRQGRSRAPITSTCIVAYWLTLLCTDRHTYILHKIIFAHLHTDILTHWHSITLAYLHSFLLAHLPTCTLAYLHTWLLAHFSISKEPKSYVLINSVLTWKKCIPYVMAEQSWLYTSLLSLKKNQFKSFEKNQSKIFNESVKNAWLVNIFRTSGADIVKTNTRGLHHSRSSSSSSWLAHHHHYHHRRRNENHHHPYSNHRPSPPIKAVEFLVVYQMIQRLYRSIIIFEIESNWVFVVNPTSELKSLFTVKGVVTHSSSRFFV